MALGRCGRAAALAIAVCGLLPATVQAAPGDLDPTFGDAGIVQTHIGPTYSHAWSVAMAFDDSERLVVAGGGGYVHETEGMVENLVLARYLPDGSLDASFGSGGIVELPSESAGVAIDMVLDSAGRIVVAGQADGPSSTDTMVARYLPTGEPDTSFGGDGVVTIDFGEGSYDSAEAVTVDDSDRVLIAGVSTGGPATETLLARYATDGSFDTSFGGGDGTVIEPMTDPTGPIGAPFLPKDLALDDSGRIVVVGSGFVAARFLASGALDTSFGDNGLVGHRVGVFDDATKVIIEPATGNILVGGQAGEWEEESEEALIEYDFAVVRYSEAGALDASFGDGDSMAVADVRGHDTTTGFALDENGRIVVGGTASDFSEGTLTEEFAVVRFLPSGRISGSFGGGDGVVTADLGAEAFGTEIGFAAVDDSGRIVQGGSASFEDETDGFTDLVLLRYEGGPAVDVLHDLTVQTAGEGEGRITGLGIDCGSTCAATYDEGTIVTLTATPAHDELGEAEAIFTGWSGDCEGEAETCQVTMDAAKEATANFEPLAEEEPPVEEEPPEEELPDESSEEEPSADAATPPTMPPAPVASGNQPPAAPRAPLAVASRVAHGKGGKALLRLRCHGQAACRGIAKLVARVRIRQSARRSAKRAKNVVLGRSRFRVPAGRTKVLRIHLNRKGRRLLRRAGRRGLRARLVGRGLRNRVVRLKVRKSERRRSHSAASLSTRHLLVNPEPRRWPAMPCCASAAPSRATTATSCADRRLGAARQLK